MANSVSVFVWGGIIVCALFSTTVFCEDSSNGLSAIKIDFPSLFRPERNENGSSNSIGTLSLPINFQIGGTHKHSSTEDGDDKHSSDELDSEKHKDKGSFVHKYVFSHYVVSNRKKAHQDTPGGDDDSSDSSIANGDEVSGAPESKDHQPTTSTTSTTTLHSYSYNLSTTVKDTRPCFACKVDYFGNDVKKIENGVPSIYECQKLCQQHSFCEFFSYVDTWGGCYLKHSKINRKQNADLMIASGSKYCTAGVHGNTECYGKTLYW